VIRSPRATAGFTLIEAIVAIVITGILSGIVAVFIAKPVQGYVDAVRRAELTDAADVALRRISRDVRLALPNSLRTTTGGFEFIITKSGGRYRDPADGSTAGDFLSFTDATDKTFHILGTSPANPPAIASGDYMVIYNLGTGYAPADAYASGAQTNRTTLQLTSGTPYTATMATNVFAAQTPPLPSPDSRFQIVGASEKVVRYICTGGALTRQSGCDFSTTTTCAGSALLAGSTTAEPKASCTIDYTSAATGRNGMLYIELKLTDTPSGESVTLFQQIHVANAP
jgi:MSHA biogenesis protein MshO